MEKLKEKYYDSYDTTNHVVDVWIFLFLVNEFLFQALIWSSRVDYFDIVE